MQKGGPVRAGWRGRDIAMGREEKAIVIGGGSVLLLTFVGIAGWGDRIGTPIPRTAPSAAPSSARRTPTGTSIGATVTVQEVAGNRWWPCGSTEQAFDEVEKWVALRDNREAARTLIRTRSYGLSAGAAVKILDSGFGRRLVRVLDGDNAGAECWISTRALGGL